MRLRHHFRYILMTLAFIAFTIPIASEACHNKRHCGGCLSSKGGVVFNEHDGMYYRIPSTKCGMIYRIVDNKYVPVGTCGYYSCKKHHWVSSNIRVICKATPGWWWGTTWMSPSQECWYVR
ncbi:MAG TPA: hypothetical protein VL360_08630 [Gammaproteobacteria bacterium]|jgi:hypothetical protein|nr:hypothetical protein [Gammaproteobacteria bacterium]